jgi:hypothetical protein
MSESLLWGITVAVFVLLLFLILIDLLLIKQEKTYRRNKP